jgi:dTDP-4-amino-4,6-dideoxygalactose transaminase
LVHLYGQAADVAAIKEIADRHGLRVIEDCAQCHGATYQEKQWGQRKRLGSIGDVGCFSFYPTKNLGALGDGGAVVTNDPQSAEQIRKFREYGWSKTRESTLAGMNSRLDEMQAAILRVKLRHLDTDNACRKRLAANYDVLLAELPLRLPRVRPESTHVYHQYVVQTDRRDELLAHLKSHRVGVMIHYPLPVHLQAAYQGRLRGCDDLPQTESVVRRILSLPIYPELTQEDQRHVVGTINNFAAARDDRRRAA